MKPVSHLRSNLILNPVQNATLQMPQTIYFVLSEAKTVLFVIAFLLLAFSSQAQCPTAPGNPSVYGTDSWIGYVYANINTNNPPTDAFTATYRGYITQTETFDQNLYGNALSGPNLCGTYSNQFSIRFRMRKNFPAGYYTFTVGGDDGYRLSIDGASPIITNWVDHSYASSTSNAIYLSGNKELVLEYYEQGGDSQVSFSYIFCAGNSTAPTSITGTTSICNGSSTTLTATGGTAGTGVSYQWGTGNVGNNVIATQSGSSITVSPTTNTTYWVRRIDGGSCSNTTSGVTQTVTVTNSSTAPTWISGATTICPGNSVTLTANGGTLATGSVYQWGTGTTGSNIISGQTGASITVSPTVNTTYWVRRADNSPCSPYTAAVTASVNVNTVPGDGVTYGSDSWIGYVYSAIDGANPPTAPFSATYRGYITQPETFSMNLGDGSLSGANLCDSYANQFAIRFKMQKNFTPGYYTFTVGGDDGYRLSLNDGSTFPVDNWNDHGYATTTSTTYYLSGPTKLILEYYEQGGSSQVSFSYVACTNFSTAPTSITGTTSICNGSNTTLTATGGTHGSNATYQWGTGTVGNNIMWQTSASITVNPNTTTTYWVKRVDGAPCNMTTTAVSQTVTVATASTAPTGISGTTSICSGNSTTLTANGGTSATGAVFQWGTGATGSNIISGETNASITVSPTTNTTYWVRRIDLAPCNTQTSAQTVNITVAVRSTAPTSISNATSICSPSGGVNLSAQGGTSATGAVFQWGTGSVVGTNPIAGANYSPYYVNPTTVTTYWVRRSDAAPCGGYTDGVTITVYPASTAPGSLTGTSSICAGSSTTLTASGGVLSAIGSYQWGTGSTGSNIISGETNATLTVSPTTTTTYWVRRNDATPCGTQTSAQTITVTVNNPSTAPTSISAGTNPLCYGTGGTNLTAVGGSGTVYEWGTGTVIGANPIPGANYSPYYVNPTVTTTYWVRRANGSPCTGYTAGVFLTVNVTNASTAPTSISGTTSVCNGNSTTLTAVGGTLVGGAYYQWGLGYTPGNDILSGQNGISMTVSPTAQTTYWVRIVNGSPCTTATGGVSVTVNITSGSTAPTTISGAGTIACSGSSTTLTASGGTAATGSSYQWGTGTSIGSNVITGQTGASLTVTPTATTTYWVRRQDTGGCAGFTAAISATVTVTATPGNPAVFGTNSWNVYGYSGSDLTLATTTYKGYYTVSTLGFDTQNGTNSWGNTLSPSSSAGWNGCPVPVENFTMVHKRKGFPCGNYTLTMQNWDDATEMYLDGVRIWSCADWSGASSCSGATGTYALTANSEIEVRTREITGQANVALNIVSVGVASTAPTSISGGTTVCSGTPVTLTANGGTTGSYGTFQWGTGSTFGSNVLTGQTTASITVSPTVNTTYWVRRIDSPCSTTTAGITQLVTVGVATVAGTLSTSQNTICRNMTPNDIVLSGQTGNVIKWQYANDSAFTNGVTDIASTATTLTGAAIGPVASTRYFRAVVQNGSCALLYTAPVTITVPAAITYSNGSWNGTPSATTPVIISGNLTLATSINVCSCQVTGTAVVTIPSGTTLTVQGDISVASTANILVENNGSLVQVSDNAIDVGNITVKRKSQPMKQYDYTYWASPVQGWKLNQLSPNTLADKYYSFNPLIDNWVSINGGTQAMEASRGYIIRAPQGWNQSNATQGVYEGTFSGVPNSGVIPVTIQKGAGTYNLIGNPYPSAIDIDLFLLDPANANIVNGTVYLWTHNTAISNTIPGNGGFNYTRDDYAKYNITGGVKTASAAITGGAIPTGKIASGQGFFIEANSALPNGNYTATFRNSMRVVNNNHQFFRINPSAAPAGLEKHRIWLHLSNATGAYDEMLLGYVEGATDAMDSKYDGPTFPAGNVVSFYSLLAENTLSIQGKALPFNVADVIPLGYNSTVAGTFSIGLENFDGLFATQDVFLVDKSDNSYHSLKTAAYSFTTATGTFNNRFELRFTEQQLGIDHPVSANDIIILKNNKHITVDAGQFTLQSLSIFDLTGKLLYLKDKINTSEFNTSDLSVGTQVLLVKVTLDDNQVVTKKLIMN